MTKKKQSSINEIMTAQKIYSVYQPIVDVKAKSVFGYEALTRGADGMRFPEQLFRCFYGEGTSNAFDLKCLHTAIQILPKLERDKCLFLNVEPVTFAQTFRKKEGQPFLKAAKPFAKQIVFELAEGMKSRDFPYLKEAVKFVRTYGFRFAIDDVSGIGSKLMKLLSIKPDFVKIDMGIIQGIANDTFQQSLLKQILKLIKKDKSAIIAEGVEKKEDLQYIKKAGISLVQGFYFARPNKKLLTDIPNL